MTPSSTAWFSMTRNVQSISRKVLRDSSPFADQSPRNALTQFTPVAVSFKIDAIGRESA